MFRGPSEIECIDLDGSLSVYKGLILTDRQNAATESSDDSDFCNDLVEGQLQMVSPLSMCPQPLYLDET